MYGLWQWQKCSCLLLFNAFLIPYRLYRLVLGQVGHLFQALEELKEVLTPELAYLSYVPLCRFLGTSYMEVSLPNHDLLRSLCLQYDENNQADHAAGDTQCWWLVGSGTLSTLLITCFSLLYSPATLIKFEILVKDKKLNILLALTEFSV